MQELASDRVAAELLAEDGSLMRQLLRLLHDGGCDAPGLARAAAAVLATMEPSDLPQALCQVGHWGRTHRA